MQYEYFLIVVQLYQPVLFQTYHEHYFHNQPLRFLYLIQL